MSNKENYDIMWYENVIEGDGNTHTGYVVTKFDNSIPNDSKMFRLVLDHVESKWKWKQYVYKDYPYATYFEKIKNALLILNQMIEE
jgi:hypothetical protein